MKQLALLTVAMLLQWTVLPAIQAQEIDLRAKASAALASQDYQTAVDVFGALTGSNPDEGGLWFGLGAAQQGLSEHKAALASYSRSFELGNQKGTSAFRIAAMHGHLEQPNEALRWLALAADEGMLASEKLVRQMPAFGQLLGQPEFDQATRRLAPCGSDAHRQFDFWVGEWDVRALNRPQASTPTAFNSISLSEDGCTLIEDYRSGPVYTGTSLSFYDRARDIWHQTWIDNQGAALYIEGKLEGNAMVLWGPAEDNPRNRVTWTPHPDGSVTQHWETSADEGQTWSTAFNGRYTRQSED